MVHGHIVVLPGVLWGKLGFEAKHPFFVWRRARYLVSQRKNEQVANPSDGLPVLLVNRRKLRYYLVYSNTPLPFTTW
jgi:hypothetical protein